MVLPESYVKSKFYQFAGRPSYSRALKKYQGSCPICREGKSWLTKRRAVYTPDNNSIRCFNCGWSGTPYKWIKELTGLSYREIITDSLEYDTVNIYSESKDCTPKVSSASLPGDCINLNDQNQIEFYKEESVVLEALELIHKRRLDVAVNRTSPLYLCRYDETKVHTDRLVIPFYDSLGKIIFYQSRSILSSDTRPKYLSKVGGTRTIFNINQVDVEAQVVYVFEGPLNSFFIKNGVAVGGIQEKSDILYTPQQEAQMNTVCRFMEKVWVLDSQWIDNASRQKTQKLIEADQQVFIWPKNIGTSCKDFNDICMAGKINEISEAFVKKHTYKGLAARLKMLEIV